MRFMVIVKADKDTEAGVLPSTELLAAMGKFNEELVKAGIMLAGEGLQPSSKGSRITFNGAKRNVVDGPFAETKELVAGFWLWQVRSKEEAIEWAKRAPMPDGSTLEVRQVFEDEDFGEQFTPELREQERRIREQTSKRYPGGACPSIASISVLAEAWRIALAGAYSGELHQAFARSMVGNSSTTSRRGCHEPSKISLAPPRTM